MGETREILRTGQATVAAHVESVLAAIREAGDELGVFVAVAGETALREAASADRLIRELGEGAWQRRPLLGVTLSVKDLIQTEQLPTMRGSLLPNRRPVVDPPVVARLRAAGAIVVGKTSTSEHGWSASTVSRVAGPATNPWARDRSAGGSSGGAAAALSAGLCSLALGTDGAGSIRIPAAFCGVVGYKPSFGHVPYVPPCADRLAAVGPLARCVADIIEVAPIISGPGHGDPDSVLRAAGPEVTGRRLRVGWIEFPGTTAEVRGVSERVLPLLADQGHLVERIDVPFDDPYQALVDVLAASEAASISAADEERCDPGRVAIARYGRALPATSLVRAEETRLELRARMQSVMDRYDLLAMATVPITPFGAGEIAPAWAADPADLWWLAWTPATYPFNLTGQPAVSLPAGLTASGLPVGLQLVGPLGGDDLLLSVASGIETDLGLRLTPPGYEAKGDSA